MSAGGIENAPGTGGQVPVDGGGGVAEISTPEGEHAIDTTGSVPGKKPGVPPTLGTVTGQEPLVSRGSETTGARFSDAAQSPAAQSPEAGDAGEAALESAEHAEVDDEPETPPALDTVTGQEPRASGDSETTEPLASGGAAQSSGVGGAGGAALESAEHAEVDDELAREICGVADTLFEIDGPGYNAFHSVGTNLALCVATCEGLI
ncbi:MAG: hypothetical protein LBD33_00880, partial [Puniceicoccales bacterium]|nr:hypothetical protein [Puniceicoccales bacterium]